VKQGITAHPRPDVLTSMSLGRLVLLPGRTGLFDKPFPSLPLVVMKASPPTSF